jgi:hypothetical protein
MPLPRMTMRRWIMVVAVVAVDCAGMLYGSDFVMAFCVVTTAAAPVLIPTAIMAHRLGPNVLGR